MNIDHAGEQRRELAYAKLYVPHQAEVVVPDRDSLYRHAVGLVGKDQSVTYLEFGVAQGASLAVMVKEFLHPDTMFIGFDSFLGLPESWLMHGPGAFSNSGVAPPFADSRVRFVTGWFQDTLHQSLPALRDRFNGRVLIHFDCDLYSSTLFLLSSLWPHCPDYHFIMDDFKLDDIVALHDFSLAYPVKIDFLACTAGGRPGSMLGRMVRTKFSL